MKFTSRSHTLAAALALIFLLAPARLLALPVVSFEKDKVECVEHDKQAQFNILLSPAPAQTVTVYLAVSGTAFGGGVDYQDFPTTVTFAAGEQRKTIKVTIVDDAIPEDPETIDLAISGAAGAAVGALDKMNILINDDDSLFEPTVIQFATAESRALENAGRVDILLNLNQAPGVATLVTYDVSGTAVAGVNYAALSGRINVAASDTKAYITVPLIDDGKKSDDKSLVLRLKTISGAAHLGEQNTHVLTIADTGAKDKPTLSFADRESRILENGGTASVKVVLSEPLDADLTANYIVGGTATPGADFTAPSGKLTIPKGQQSALINIPIIDDKLLEDFETVILTLTDAPGISMGAIPTHTLFIIDDETPRVNFSAASSSVDENARTHQVTLQLSKPSTATVTVLLQAAGTAVDGVDYKGLPTGVTFDPNTTSKTIDFEIIDNDKVDIDRTLLLTLAQADRAELGERTAHTVTIKNDDKYIEAQPLPVSPAGIPASVPDVGVDGQGRAHVVWRAREGLIYYLWYARVGSDGKIDLTPTKVWTPGSSYAFRPRLAAGPDGRAYVIMGSQSNSYLTFLSLQDGRTSGSRSMRLFNPNTWTTQNYYNPAIDLNPVTRRPYIMSEANLSMPDTANPGLTIYWNGLIGTELDRDGNLVGGTLWAPYYLQNHAPLIDMATRPDVAVDKFGQAHCAWLHKDRDWGGAVGIGYSRQWAGGVNNWVELTDPLQRNVRATDGGPRVCCIPQGAVDVGWMSNDYKNYFWTRLKGSGFLQAGTRTQMLDTTATYPYQPAQISAGGASFFAWTDQRTGPKQIFYRTQLKSSRPRNLSSGTGDAFDAQLAASPDGSAACVWADNRDGVQRIYYRAISGTVQIAPEQEYDRVARQILLRATVADGQRGTVTGRNRDVIFNWRLSPRDGGAQLGEGSMRFDEAKQVWVGGKTFEDDLQPGYYRVDYEISYIADNGEMRGGEGTGEFFVEHYFSLAGLCYDEKTNEPLQNTRVTIGGQSVMSDAQGKYYFSELAASNGTELRARHLTHARYTKRLTVPNEVKAMNWPVPLRPATPKPAVTALEGKFEGRFLFGESVENEYTASVDWGSGDPKSVLFYVNGNLVAKVDTQNEYAVLKINMNNPYFNRGKKLGDNKLVAIAEGIGPLDHKIYRSNPYVKTIDMVHLPKALQNDQNKVELLKWNPQGRSYEASFKFPGGSFLIKPLAYIPFLKSLSVVPQVGFGFKYSVDTSKWEASFSVIYKPKKPEEGDANPVAEVTPPALKAPTLGLGDVDMEFEVNATAEGQASEEIDFKAIKINVSLKVKYKLFQFNLVNFLPVGGPAIANLMKIAAKLGMDVNDMVSINFYIIPKVGAALPLNIEKWQVDNAELNGEFGAEGAWEPDFKWFKMNLYFGGLGALKAVLFTPNYLAELKELNAKIYCGFEAVFHEIKAYEQRITLCEYTKTYIDGASPAYSRVVELDGHKYLVRTKTMPPGAVERPDPRLGINQFVANESGARAPGRFVTRTGVRLSPLEAFRAISLPAAQVDQLGVTTAGLPLLQNVYTYSDPALAASGSNLMLLYVTDSGNPALKYQFTDVYWTAFNGTSWSKPAPIATDTRGEFAPSVSYDGSGNAVAVWERVSDPSIQRPDIDAMLAKNEIVYACKTPTGGWSAPVARTNNTWLDHAPRLCGPMSDGSLLLTWTENQKNLLMGTGDDGATSNSRVLWCKWTPATRSWSAPQTLVDHMRYRLSDTLAGRGDKAIYAWTQDKDGILSTTQDQEVYCCRWNGSGWNAPEAITSDNVPDNDVRAAVTAGGMTCLTWKHDQNLVLNTDLLTTTIIRMDALTPGFADYAMTAGPNNNVALIWQDVGPSGTNAHYSVYDPQTTRWSQAFRFITGDGLQRSYATAWDAAGNLTMAYNQVQISKTTQTLTMDDGSTVTVPNYPTRGPTTLSILKTSLGCDPAIDPGALEVHGDKLRPGAGVTLQAWVRNNGNLAATNPEVAFYDGPPTTATEIARTSIPGWLDGHAITTVTATWTIPTADTAHVLYAVVDPDRVIGDVNRANNTQALNFGGVDLTPHPGAMRALLSGAAHLVVQVENKGTVSAPPTVLALRRQGASAVLATAAVAAVPPGKIVEASLDLPLGSIPAGTRGQFTVTADNTGAGDDVDRSNNSADVVIPNSQPPSAVQFVTSAQTVPIVEGGRRAFTVRLSDRPTTDVKAQVQRISGDTGLSVVSGASLTFTRDNWTSGATVTLASARDADALDGQATFAINELTDNGIDSAFVTALELDSNSVHAITQGSLAGTTTWNDTAHDYVLAGTVTVPAGATLRIGPGVTVRLAEGTGKPALVVQGSLDTTDSLFILETRHNTLAASRVSGIVVGGAGKAAFRRCTLLTRELGSPFAGNYADWSAAIAASGSARLTVLGCAFEALDGSGGARTTFAAELEEGVAVQLGSDAVSGLQSSFRNFDAGLEWLAGAGAKLVDRCVFQGCRWNVRLRGSNAAQDIVLNNPRQVLSGLLTLGTGRLLSLEPGSDLQSTSFDCLLTVPAGAQASLDQARLDLKAPLVVAGRLDALSSTLALHTSAHWLDALRMNGIELQGSAVAALTGCNLKATEDNFTGEWSALINQGSHASLALDGCFFSSGNPAGLLPTCAVRCASDNTLSAVGTAFLGNATAVRFDTIPTSVTLSANAFQGNRVYAVQNRTTKNVDARGNWWGAPSGPTHPSNPKGTGDRVSNYVIFSNWLSAPATAQAALADPATGQERSNLTGAATLPGVELIGLRVNPPDGAIQQLVFHLSHRAGGMAWSKLTGFRLLIDGNGNGRIDPEEQNAVGGPASLSGDADNLWVTFSEPIDSYGDTGAGLILVADLTNLTAGDGFTVEVEPGAALMAGGTPYLTQVTPVTHVNGGGAILSDRAGGQLGNRFGAGATQKGVGLFAFTLSGGDRRVQWLDFTLSGLKGLAASEITSVTLFTDTNGNGQRDSGEPAATRGGVVTISGSTGKIHFGTAFAAGQSYLLTADLANLAAGDQMTIALTPGNIHLDSGQATGAASAAAHLMDTPVVVTGLGSAYALDQLLLGKAVYSDLAAYFTLPIPMSCYKQLYIRTKNAQKDLANAGLISFSVNRRVRIYVAVDDLAAQVPSWLLGWRVEPDRLTTTDSHPGRRLYSKAFNPGAVVLGGNRETGMPTGFQMYSVVITPEPGSGSRAEDWSLYE